MSDFVPSGHVLSGYIPDKFGAQLVHIDSAHPLAARLVGTLARARTRPVIVIEGGEYDGQVVDLNDCTIDYAMGQLGTRYYVVEATPTAPPRIVAHAVASSERADPVLASLPPAIVVPPVADPAASSSTKRRSAR